MAKPKPGKSALTPSELSALRAQIALPPHIHWDPIDMDHVLQIDRSLAKQVAALRLETQSELHRVMAEGTAKAARLMK
jgi:hypothetical protein